MNIVDMLKEQFGSDAITIKQILPDDTVVVTLDKKLIPFEQGMRLCFEDPLIQLIPWCRLKVINNRVSKAIVIPAGIEAAVSEDELTAMLYHELGHLHDPAVLALLRGVDDTRDQYAVELYADNYAVKHGYGRYISSALVKAIDAVVAAMEADKSLGDPAETRDELTKIAVTRIANLQQSIAAFEQHSVAV